LPSEIPCLCLLASYDDHLSILQEKWLAAIR
jgi:hypothetical protein